MTIGITGPRRRAPWRGAVVVLIIAAIVLSVCLILLALTGDFLVDWLWFSTIGYLGVFWTTIAAEAEVFFVVFVATAIILWVNGSLASRFARSPWTQRPADFEWKRTGIAAGPDVLEFMRHRLPWPFVTASSGRIAVGVLPNVFANPLARLEPYGMLILIGLLFILPMLGAQLGVDLSIVSRVIASSTDAIIGAILLLTGNA